MLSALVRPAYCSVPESVSTLGPEVADLAQMVGFTPDPEQRLALDHLFAMGPAGKVAAMEFALICSRQNMKTGLFKQAALGWLFVTEERLVVWSAHEFGTAQEAFRDMTTLIESSPMLDRRVKQIHRGNGDEAIELLNGSRLKFKARTKGGGRGLSGGKVVLDEAYALKPEHMGALLPLLSAQPDPQVVYGSSAGHATSDVLRSVRDRGRAGGDPSLAYLEWCDDLPGECADPRCEHTITSDGCRLDDEERWARANPAMGRRISRAYIANERRALPPAEFARERLGWWDEPDADEPPVINAGAWADQEDADSAPESPHGVCFAVSVSPDRKWTTIASSGRRADGDSHVEIAQVKSGTRWVKDWLLERVEKWQPCAVVINPAGPEGSLIADLAEAGLEIVQPTARELGQAFGMFYSGVMVEKTLWHRPGEGALTTAVEAGRDRPLGDAKTWDQRGDTDISPVVAATNALWGFNVHGAERAPSIW